MKISVIIPVYKTDVNAFNRCLKSVEGQDCASVEVLIIFDGHPSNSILNIVQRFPDFNFIEIPHGGVSTARNFGIQKATGKYLTFVDADDELPKGSLRKMFEFAETNHCDIVQGSYDAVFSALVEHHSYRKSDVVFAGFDLQIFKQDILKPDKGVSLVWGKLFLRSLIIDNQIQFDTEMAVSEDTAFVFDASAKAVCIGFISSTVYQYMRSDASTVSSYRSDYERRILCSIEHMKAHIDCSLNIEEYRSAFQSYVLFHLLLIQVHYLFNPSAPWTEKERYAQYKSTLQKEPFRSSLVEGQYSDFSLGKKISLYMLRWKIYPISYLISFIRHKQISKAVN